MKAAIYARFSSDKQSEDSIEAQVRACNEYAARNGLSIVGVYADEAISGKGSKTASRRQYQRLLKDASKGLFDTVLIHKYDRVARNLAEHVTLEMRLRDKGIALIATAQDFGQSNEAKIMKSLMWALSEYYNDNLADETRKGLKEKALKGLHTGGIPPFGYDVVDQRYVINELEAGYVRRIFQAALNREGFTNILKEMEQAGINGKRGRVIKYTQVYEMLRNEKYTGTYVYCPVQAKDRAERRSKPNAIKIEDALPVIVDKSVFMEVQKIMDNRKQTGNKAGYLCSGLVYCECGAKMHGHASKDYKYYKCSAKCGGSSVRMDEVDKAAIEYLHDLLSPANQATIAAALRDYNKQSNEAGEVFKTATNAKIAEKQKQYDALFANLSSGKLPATVLEDVGAEMESLKAEISALEEAEPPKDYTPDTVTAWLQSLKEAPDKKAIHLLIERIDINRENKKTEYNIKSTLQSVLCENGSGGGI